MNIKKILLFVILALVLAGIAWFSWLMIEDKRSYDLYVNQKEGMSMKYPKGWTVVEYPKDSGAIVVMVKPKANAFVTWQASWNISATTLAEPLTLEQYVKAAHSQVLFLFQDATAIAYPYWISGHEGRELVYINKTEGGLVFISYVFIYKGVAYNISYMGDKDDYLDPKKKRAITHVIRSLKVKF